MNIKKAYKGFKYSWELFILQFINITSNIKVLVMTMGLSIQGMSEEQI